MTVTPHLKRQLMLTSVQTLHTFMTSPSGIKRFTCEL